MDIKKLDDKVRKIYEVPEDQWSRKLKDVSTGRLVNSVLKIIDKTSKKETKVWVLASAILNELWARPYAKDHPQVMSMMRDTIIEQSQLCLIDEKNGVEAAGIKKKIVSPHATEKKVVHPYAYSSSGRKIIAKWEKSGSDKSFDEYVKYFSKDTRRSLKTDSITYLAKDEQKEYRVSFTDSGKLLIGGKSVDDGEYIFALSADGKKLLAAKKIKGELHHSSLFAGLAVQCVGNFEVKGKKMHKVVLSSGHYKPGKDHIENLRKFLSKDENLGKREAKRLSIKPHR